MTYRMPLSKSTLGDEEITAAKGVIDSGLLTMGSRCREFERQFADYIGARNALMVNSGSSANLVALFALANPLCPQRADRRRIEQGSEIIVPSVTWSTTIWPVVQIGAIPVFVDCDPDTLQMRPDDIEAAITPKTAAIMLVHVLGGAVDVETVRELADRHKLWLIEDTCESLGVLWNGKQVGTFGDIGTYSFYFSHHITTIEGGMAVTDDDELAELMRALRAHGWTRQLEKPEVYTAAHPDLDSRFLFVTTGFNLRPTEINAAIGMEQLKRLDGFNDARRVVARNMTERLHALVDGGSLTLMRHDQRSTPAPFGFPVLCANQKARNGLREHLEANGIETRPIICGNMARQPALRHLRHRISGTLTGADRVMDCGIYWGAHPNTTDDEVRHLGDVVTGFFQ